MRGFVLAGGRSTRFGSDKSLARVEGTPMALRVFRAMEEAGLEPCFVARDRRLEHLGPVLLEDLEGAPHPLNGVVAALQAGGGVMAPCDVPWLPARAFSLLTEGSTVVGCPLLARLDASWLSRAREHLADGASVRAFVSLATPIELPANWLRNVNRPADLDRDTP